MSVQQWGEDPRGDWTINIASSDGTLGNSRILILCKSRVLLKLYFGIDLKAKNKNII